MLGAAGVGLAVGLVAMASAQVHDMHGGSVSHGPGGVMQDTLNVSTRITVRPPATRSGDTLNLVSWSPELSGIGEGLVTGKRK